MTTEQIDLLMIGIHIFAIAAGFLYLPKIVAKTLMGLLILAWGLGLVRL